MYRCVHMTSQQALSLSSVKGQGGRERDWEWGCDGVPKQEMEAILMSQTKHAGVSYENNFFCSNKFAWPF